MSSMGLSGLSNISSDTLQNRYEKALKQINKLIGINRQLKESSNHLQAEHETLQSQIQNLQQNNHDLDEQNNILDSKYMQLQGHYRKLESYCKELEQKLEINHIDHEKYEQKMNEQEIKFHQELDNEVVKYNQLVREAEMIHQAYLQEHAALQVQEQKNKQLQKDMEQLNQKYIILQQENARLSESFQEQHTRQLKYKLQQANQTIQKLFKQCSLLKNKQIDFQVQEQKQKVQKFIGFSAAKDPRQNGAIKQLVFEYNKKIKQIESDRKELQQKYRHLKSKSSKQMSEQGYLNKIERLQRFTEKQQSQIVRIIEMYDKQLNSLHRENTKLRQSYNTLSQRFNKNKIDLAQKQKLISQLKLITQRTSFEMESLKKVNQGLVDAKTSRLKEIATIKNDIAHSNSYTILEKKQTLQKQEKARSKKQYTQQSQQIKDPKISFNAEPQKQKIRYQPTSTPRQQIPITVNYRSPSGSDPGDFNFIQSVNIINGYNVNLGHPQRAKN